MNKEVILIVIEKHMDSSFDLLTKKLNERNILVNKIYLPSNDKKNTFFWRLLHGKNYLNNLRKVIEDKKLLGNENIFLSCGEGFEIANLSMWLGNLSNYNLIAIQHGIMPKTMKFHKKIFRLILNRVSQLILRFNIIGNGFGGTKLNYYMVYSSTYKSFLVNNMGWSKENIIVSGELLKERNEIKFKSDFNVKTCLLLLQDFPLAEMMSLETYKKYLLKIIDELKNNFDEVVIRLHPKMNLDDYSFLEECNVIISKNRTLKADFKKADLAMSFYSTALIDAYLYGLPVVGIYLPELKKEHYSFIETVVNYNEISELLKSVDNYKKLSISSEEIEFKNEAEATLDKLLD